MEEVEVGVGGEVEEGIGEGVVMAIKVVMEIIKDTGITRGGMEIIKIMVGIQIVDEVVGEVEVGGIVVLVMMVAGVEVQGMKVAEVEVVMKVAEVEVVMKVAEVVVVMKVAEVVVVVMKVAEVVAMKVAEVVVMKEAGVEEGVMGVVGAEWVDVQGVAAAATRHDCKGCYCHSC